ncbi:MAG: TetM/TetW/TetO/TetS family tetracycline resistance ribosomal protection protein [Christensenellaceae bacterium]|jgi:small GTP-binding protein|nr:TetM/TetW/TetO/TetS family tetracycline resistance ribosomal protection protein [Christensenellaceae bacterium]
MAHTTIGIFAHVDAGKTTLSEQILYRSGALSSLGRVDHQSAFLDHDPLEKLRGITIFAEQAEFSIGKRRYTLVDTPGHADFSAEMERSIAAMDYAILVVSAVEGLQAHAYTVWGLLRAAKLPVFFFVNKMDRAGADAARVLGEIRQNLGAPAFFFDDGMPGALPSALIEELAQGDEALLEAYLAGERPEVFWREALLSSIQKGLICPLFAGSALKGEGVDALLHALDALTATKYDESAPFQAIVTRIRHDEQGARLVSLKLLQGSLRLKDSLRLPSGEIHKISEIRRYSGGSFERISEAFAGEHLAFYALPELRVGDALGEGVKPAAFKLSPLLLAKAEPQGGLPPRQALQALRLLEEEDPQLRVLWQEESQSIQISVMGKIQLEVLRELLLARFSLDIRFGEPEILYLETLAAPSCGRGHYEPLRHYAEVHLRLSPGPRGSGIAFKDEASLDALPLHFHRLIESHIFEKQHPGALTGAPVTDLVVTLLAGRMHLKHTHGGDFRQASYRAVRQGLFKGESLLLEPYYAFSARVPSTLLGRVSSDLRQLFCSFEAPIQRGGNVELLGRGPVSTLLGYPEALAALTKGLSVLSFRFDGYEPCHNPGEIIEKRGYEKEADRENPADSIFCAKGAGYLVKWTVSDAHMHIPF